MFLAWSKQLENEGMGSRIGVSSFFISQSLSSILVLCTKYRAGTYFDADQK